MAGQRSKRHARKRRRTGTAPRAVPAALRLLADWQLWLFLFDDEYSDQSVTGAIGP